MAVYPPRNKVDKKQTWNAESVFKSPRAWEDEANKVLADLDSVKQFDGRLGEGPATLLAALSAQEQLILRVQRVYMYAGFAYAVDTADQRASGWLSKGGSIFGRVAAAVAFMSPELIAIGKVKLEEWTKQEPKLAVYSHSFDDLFRKQGHIRSGEVEELLGMLADPFSGLSNTASMITNADFKFAPAVTSRGRRLEVTQSSVHQILASSDRKARQTAWNSYMDRHMEFKNTLSSNLATSIKANVFGARARKHESSLAASLFENNVPLEVFHNLINTFQMHLPVWHRYFDIRRKALRQANIAYYDMWAPLAKKDVKLTFKESVDMICEGLRPMGKEYTDIIRKGCLEERWVDYAPNKGKAERSILLWNSGYVSIHYDELHR